MLQRNLDGGLGWLGLVFWSLVHDLDALVGRNDSQRFLVDQSAVTERAQVGQVVGLRTERLLDVAALKQESVVITDDQPAQVRR